MLVSQEKRTCSHMSVGQDFFFFLCFFVCLFFWRVKNRGFVKDEYLMIILEYFFYFSIKIYVVVTAPEPPLMSTHNMFFMWRPRENYPKMLTKSSERVLFSFSMKICCGTH